MFDQLFTSSRTLERYSRSPLLEERLRYLEPANRFVADALEAEWNLKLRALADAQQDYQQRRAADRLIIDDPERQRILALATDFPAVWRDPNTPHPERKRMLALLIEDVTPKSPWLSGSAAAPPQHYPFLARSPLNSCEPLMKTCASTLISC
jgi:hypothetical protein